MKALFKLKEQRWHGQIYLTNSHAEEIYKAGGLKQGLRRRIPAGFFCYPLNFGEWIDRYGIRIL